MKRTCCERDEPRSYKTGRRNPTRAETFLQKHRTDERAEDHAAFEQGDHTGRCLAALSADRDEGYETRFRQRIAPAMAGSVLHDAITLMQMNLLSVVQF